MILWIIVAIAAVVYLLGHEFRRFILLPVVAQNLRSRGNLPVAIRILERSVASWSLFGETLRREARFKLVWMYLESNRSEDAVQQCRLCLKRQLKPAVEAMVRSRLADCLEAAGRIEEANEERKVAGERLDSAPEDAAQLISKGEALNRERRFAEAAVAFEKAVACMPPGRDIIRGKTLVQLALAHFEAGNSEQAIRWGRESLTVNAGGTVRMVGNSVIALGYGNQGDLEESEKYYLEAIKAAQSMGNKEKAAFYLSSLGEIQRKRGNLVEAMQTCEQAAQASLGARRVARMVAFECMRSWGKWEDALEMLKQAQAGQPYPIPANERRSQALIALGRAWILTDQGKADQALESFYAAAEELMREEKVGLWCIATEAWILAALGRNEEARQKMQEALQRAPGLADSRSTLLSCMNYVGRASFEMGEFRECLTYWDRYMELKPEIVDLPKAHYFRGECLWELGEKEAALASYQGALDTGVETLYTDKARRKLLSYSTESPVASS